MLDRHTHSHKTDSRTIQFQRQLPSAAKKILQDRPLLLFVWVTDHSVFAMDLQECGNLSKHYSK